MTNNDRIALSANMHSNGQNRISDVGSRKLTNAAGGNFAVKVDEGKILVPPSMTSEHNMCELCVEDFLLIDYQGYILEGRGKLSAKLSCAF